MKVLFIEDERKSQEMISNNLKKEGYIVESANNAEAGFNKAVTSDYDIIVLELQSPIDERIAFAKDLRDLGIYTPLILLATEDCSKDKVAVLDAGADDYLVKPLDFDEFMARMRVLTRRKNKDIVGNKLQVSGLVLDPLKCEVVNKSKTIKLSVKETLLLEILMRNTGNVVTREQIFDRVWGYCSPNELSNVDLYVYYLRRKLSKTYIRTVRGIGYFFEKNLEVV
jgi:DNA-binding response OmpR family regulator